MHPAPSPTSLALYRCPSGCVILGLGRASMHLTRDELAQLGEALEIAVGSPAPRPQRPRRTPGAAHPWVRLTTCGEGCTRVAIGGVTLHLGSTELLELAGAMRGLAADAEPALAN